MFHNNFGTLPTYYLALCPRRDNFKKKHEYRFQKQLQWPYGAIGK
jgi:hypothetical protein